MSHEVRLFGLSDMGQVREENQDSLRFESPEDEDRRRRRGDLLVVADGMGGLKDGKIASRLATDRIARDFYESEGEPSQALLAAVQAANRDIFEYAQVQGGGQPMGSTCTALAVLGDKAFVAQVGDSRAYRYHRGEIRQVTRDHSLVRELLDRGEIEKDSVQYTFHRNVLTRGLGLRHEVDVDLFELTDVESGDLFILTSDGLHELVTEGEFLAGIGRHRDDLNAFAQGLIDLANERGGSDNITAGLAAIGPVAPPLTRGEPGDSTEILAVGDEAESRSSASEGKGCLGAIVVLGALAAVAAGAVGAMVI